MSPGAKQPAVIQRVVMFGVGTKSQKPVGQLQPLHSLIFRLVRNGPRQFAFDYEELADVLERAAGVQSPRPVRRSSSLNVRLPRGLRESGHDDVKVAFLKLQFAERGHIVLGNHEESFNRAYPFYDETCAMAMSKTIVDYWELTDFTERSSGARMGEKWIGDPFGSVETTGAEFWPFFVPFHAVEHDRIYSRYGVIASPFDHRSAVRVRVKMSFEDEVGDNSDEPGPSVEPDRILSRLTNRFYTRMLVLDDELASADSPLFRFDLEKRKWDEVLRCVQSHVPDGHPHP
ncbi:hypothetical protein M3Y99_00708100 [Aphelenchoides fujianensis]|nr:hypothetical protein M3Y99_00708100 [Aphelenchoides fujianensis]